MSRGNHCRFLSDISTHSHLFGVVFFCMFRAEADDVSTSGILILPSAWLYNPASAAVARFLHGPVLPADHSDEGPHRSATNCWGVDIEGSTLRLTISMHSLVAGSLKMNSNPVSSGSDGSSEAEAEGATAPPTNSTTHRRCPASRAPTPLNP
jgi:hypothetical protein